MPRRGGAISRTSSTAGWSSLSDSPTDLLALRRVTGTFSPLESRRRLRANSQCGTTQNAITAYWSAAATITRAWKTSWYPNTAGSGSGRPTA
jgi:hypothetical protein